MKVLVLCTGNACRSQMAHAFLEKMASGWEVFSAGTTPADEIHPMAIEVMKEKGIDIQHHRPEHVGVYQNQSFDCLITVCDDANENCPVFSGKVKKRFHFPFEDPAAYVGSDQDKLSFFRIIRNQIKNKMFDFYNTTKNE